TCSAKVQVMGTRLSETEVTHAHHATRHHCSVTALAIRLSPDSVNNHLENLWTWQLTICFILFFNKPQKNRPVSVQSFSHLRDLPLSPGLLSFSNVISKPWNSLMAK